MWKDVIYNEAYEINEEGIVRRKSNKNVLKGCIASGYRSVKLTFENSRQQRFYVHRLVAIHFIENDDPQHKTFVNHKDGDKLNNSVDNLEWVTPRENNLHYYQNTKKEQKEKKQGNKAIPVIQMLNNEEVARFPSIKKASEATGISVVQIARCIHGEINHTGPYQWIQQ